MSPSFKNILVFIYIGAIGLMISFSGFNPFAKDAIQLVNAELSLYYWADKSREGEKSVLTSNFGFNQAHDGRDAESLLSVDTDLDWKFDEFQREEDQELAMPAVDSSGIYFGAPTSHIIAVSHQGTRLWSFQGRPGSNGFVGSPIVDKDSLFVGTKNGSFYLLRKSDGHPLWTLHHPDKKLIFVQGSSQFLFLVVRNKDKQDQLLKIERATGKILWEKSELNSTVVFQPSVDVQNSLILLPLDNGTLLALDTKKGEKKWEYFDQGSYSSPPIVVEGETYLSTQQGEFLALENLGGSLKWKSDLGSKTKARATWIPDIDILFLGLKSGEWKAINRKTGTHRWGIQSKTNLSQSISGIVVKTLPKNKWRIWVACSENKICAIDPMWGRIEKRILMETELKGTPVSQGRSFYLIPNSDWGLQKFSKSREGSTASSTN
ncbi:MAG: PQQ-binding-like beta-propeller repeat protein [Pseudomonadota bacterium]